MRCHNNGFRSGERNRELTANDMNAELIHEGRNRKDRRRSDNKAHDPGADRGRSRGQDNRRVPQIAQGDVRLKCT